MNQVCPRNNRLMQAAVILTGLIANLLVWPSAGGIPAQQKDRELVQTNAANVSTGKRSALVIGNGAYTNAPRLKNPPNDARAMTATLQSLGFDVTSGVNTNQRDLKRLIRQFGQKLKAGGSGLFYYAGHGVQSKGRNFLIPVDADIESEADVEDAGVDVSLILNYMDDAQNGLNIVIMDACRNNPFSRSFRSASSGLAQVDAPTGTLIAYATAPGRVAADGVGENGLYTSELLKAMRMPGLTATEMFMRVRAQVMRKTANKQVPWESSSLVGDFFFNEPKSERVPPSRSSNVTLAGAGAVEADYWESIRNSSEATDFQAYLKEYPEGRYGPLARIRLNRLEAAGKKISPSASASHKSTGRSGALKRLVQNEVGIDLVLILSGSFQMGSTNRDSDDKPVHQVTIRYPFYIGRTEVTQAQWQSVMRSNPSHFKGENLPVETVSWEDAQAFIQKLNQQDDGYLYRLPSEAEWEYACRGGTTGDYAGDLDAMAWHADNSGKARINSAEIWRTDNDNYVRRVVTENEAHTHPVGSKAPNSFGLYDMHGNVWEWCEDWYQPNYEGAPTDGTAWLVGGEKKYRVLRGGSWSDDPNNLHSASRFWYGPDTRANFIGFRVVAIERT